MKETIFNNCLYLQQFSFETAQSNTVIAGTLVNLTAHTE